MRGLVLAVGVLMGSGALAAEAVAFELQGDPARGKATFKQLCASCHGDKGKGNGPAAVALNPKPRSFLDPEVSARLTPQWVYTLVKDGGAAHGKSPQMVAMGKAFTDAQVRDVAAYALTLLPPR